MSGDGNTALIGADGDNGNHGAAWVFTRSGSAWTQQGPKLTGEIAGIGGKEIGEGDFGLRTALSSDGNTALIGAPFDKGSRGAAWAFETRPRRGLKSLVSRPRSVPRRVKRQ